MARIAHTRINVHTTRIWCVNRTGALVRILIRCFGMALIVLRSNRTTKLVNLQPVAIRLRISSAIWQKVFRIYALVCRSTIGIQLVGYANLKNQIMVRARHLFNAWPTRICIATESSAPVRATITGRRTFAVRFWFFCVIKLICFKMCFDESEKSVIWRSLYNLRRHSWSLVQRLQLLRLYKQQILEWLTLRFAFFINKNNIRHFIFD